MFDFLKTRRRELLSFLFIYMGLKATGNPPIWRINYCLKWVRIIDSMAILNSRIFIKVMFLNKFNYVYCYTFEQFRYTWKTRWEKLWFMIILRIHFIQISDLYFIVKKKKKKEKRRKPKFFFFGYFRYFKLMPSATIP